MDGPKSEQARGRAKRPASKRKREPPRVTPMDRLRWSREVARLKSDDKTWSEIAAATGMSQARCRRLYAQLRAAGDPDAPLDAWAWVYRRLDALTITMEEAASTYAAAPAGSAAAVGALKVWEATSEKMLELAARVGWVPRQLGALSAERVMQEMFREMARIAEKHNAPDAMVREFLDLAERKVTGRDTIAGRALPAG